MVIRLLAYSSKRTRIIGVSTATAAVFKGQLNFGDRVAVLHNGVELSLYPQKTATEISFKTELGLTREEFLFCAVGQIAPRKGLKELLAAFVQVCERSAKAHLAIVGEAIFNKDYEYRDEVVELSSTLGLDNRVHFTGARRDIANILRSVDVLVLNSLQEPFGLVLVEAMSSGTAVVAADVGGIPEIVSDGVTGWLVCPTDTASVANRLTTLVSFPELLPAVQQAALNTVCPRFSTSKFLEGIHSYYAKLELKSRDAVTLPISAERLSQIK